MSVCLDSFALLAWLQNESEAAIVEGHLQQANKDISFECLISAINLAEVYYRLYRMKGQISADKFWSQCQHKVIPVTITEVTQKRILEAGRLKAQYPLALGDAFAIQIAQEQQLPLVTGDPEILALEGQLNLIIQKLQR